MSTTADVCFWCSKPAIKTTWVKGAGPVGDCGSLHQKPYKNAPGWTHRNWPCPCGSGKKYKKCCLNKEVRNAGTEQEIG